MMRFVSVAAALLLAGPVSAQTATATPAEAFVYALERVCGPNIQGRLPFNPPSPALDAAHLMLVDGASDPDTRAAFHDMSATNITYGAVQSATGQITIGVDETLAQCRVAAIDVTAADVTAIQSGMMAIDADWNPTAHTEATGTTSYNGTLDGDVIFATAILPVAGQHWGPKTGLIVTLANPAAQEE